MADFVAVTVPDSAAYRMVVSYMEEMCQRAFTSGENQGTSAAGRPLVFEGVGAPWPELHRPPRLFDPDVVSTGATESDELRIVNYAQGVARAFNNVFRSVGLAEPATVANIVIGGTINITLQSIQTELQAIATAWNANELNLQRNPSAANPNFPSMPTTVTLP